MTSSAVVVLLIGLVVFGSESVLAGLAHSVEVLIAGRALQGLGAALIPPAALATIAVTFEEGDDRNKALGLYGAVTGISASVGVLASGLLTDGIGWRSIFPINVPIGLLLIAMVLRFLPTSRTVHSERFDVAGAVMIAGSLLLLVYGLTRSAQLGWSSAETVALLAAAGVLLCGFVWAETGAPAPLIPAAAARSRSIVAACVAALFTFGALFSFIFLGSLLMQELLRYSPTRTGVGWLAATLVSFVAAVVTGARLVDVLGVRRLLIVGQLLLAGAALVLTRIPADAGYAADLLPALLLVGIAGGLAAPAYSVIVATGVLGAVAAGFLCPRTAAPAAEPEREVS